MEVPPPQLLDVDLLLETSEPRPRANWFWYGVGTFALVVMLSSYLASRSQGAKQMVDLGSVLLMLGLGAAMGMMSFRAVKAQRREQKALEAMEELVQLRRWEQAALILREFLSQPARIAQARTQALFYLTSVLARFHRFEDCLKVQEYLLDQPELDPMSAYGVRLGRAMTLLRQDHLVDANQAIAELKRMVGDQPSAGVALIDLYRDVITGHPTEAIEVFQEKREILRDQLGHRVADAYGLVACAFELLGRNDEAKQYYEDATRLSPVEELHRRYPQIAKLGEKYAPAQAPKGAA